jgi:signal transduction histidine kinase
MVVPSSDADTEHASRRSETVWVVDDSPLAAEFARRILEARYSVETFSSGASLLERLAAGTRPDLLVLDWQMPELSGLDVCRFVRQTNNQAELPILLLTAAGDHLVEGLRNGANDFLLKPPREAEFLARAESLIRSKLVHEELSRAQASLREEAELREQFVGILGHDLRQPLNTLLMACSLLKQDVLSPAHLAMVVRMDRASHRMHRMICELLDFTRIRRGGGLAITRREVDLHETLRHVVEDMTAVTPGRPVELVLEGSGRGAWDPDWLAQLCENLVANALEHSPPGTPVHVAVGEQASDLVLEVRNGGPGIPADRLGALFEPFKRGGARSSSSKGLGLGLFIANQVAKAHGGAITVESDANQTRFVVRLPRGAPTIERDPAASVLLVEDDPSIAVNLAALLRNEGLTVRVAANGQEAWSELVDGLSPAVLVLDLVLPVMDGWSLRRKLLDEPRFASLPVVALTAASPSEIAALERVEDVLHKPFEFQALLASVRRCIGASRSSSVSV